MTSQIIQKVNNELRTLQSKCLTKKARAEELKPTMEKRVGRLVLSFLTIGASKVVTVPQAIMERAERKQVLKDLLFLEFRLAETYYTHINQYGSEGVHHVNSTVLMSHVNWNQARNSLNYKLREMVRDGRLRLQNAAEDIAGVGQLAWTMSNLFELFSENVLGQQYDSIREILWDEVNEDGGDEILEEMAETFLDFLVA